MSSDQDSLDENNELTTDFRVVVPGERLCESDGSFQEGRGTYIQQGSIFSSTVGRLVTKEAKDKKKQIIEVHRHTDQNLVPSAGDVVTARVISVNPRFCKCAITCIRETSLHHSFNGIIRKEDVRATEKDSVKLYNCFRPNDVVLARVLSLGDSHAYLLSTAENELGVVVAHSEAGEIMVPVGWNEFQCPKTFLKEERKVAKNGDDTKEDYSRLLEDWQEHVNTLDSDLVDIDEQIASLLDSNNLTRTASHDILEATDIYSLLDQFESTQGTDWLLDSPKVVQNETHGKIKSQTCTAAKPEKLGQQNIVVHNEQTWQNFGFESIQHNNEKVIDSSSKNSVGVDVGILPNVPLNDVIVPLNWDHDDGEIDIDWVEDSQDVVSEEVIELSTETVLKYVNLDHDYCFCPTEEEQSNLYSRIPDYYSEKVLLDTSGSELLPHSPELEVDIEDNDAEAADVDTAKNDVDNMLDANGTASASSLESDGGLYSRLPPYVLGLPSKAVSEDDADTDVDIMSIDDFEKPVASFDADEFSVEAKTPAESFTLSPKDRLGSRSRSRSPIRSVSRSSSSCSSRSTSPSSRDYYSSKRRNPRPRYRFSEWEEEEERAWRMERSKHKPLEDRRVIYVGNIPPETKRSTLRRRFSEFGPIEHVSVHFREHGDNYGFVTFIYKCDAIEALEHGNDLPNVPKYDLCFGGRRQFCQSNYADLDGLNEVESEDGPKRGTSSTIDFDMMLQAAQVKMKKIKGNSNPS